MLWHKSSDRFLFFFKLGPNFGEKVNFPQKMPCFWYSLYNLMDDSCTFRRNRYFVKHSPNKLLIGLAYCLPCQQPGTVSQRKCFIYDGRLGLNLYTNMANESLWEILCRISFPHPTRNFEPKRVFIYSGKELLFNHSLRNTGHPCHSI